jgi:CheY-like chemotaxis protein
MRDSAGQLTDQVELLGVPERRLRLAAIGDLAG